MKSLIVANWKLNPITLKEARTLFDAVKKGAKSKNTDVVICPPFVYLSLLKGLTLGAQNVSVEDKGAFTGEISAWQLKDLGVKYVIVGHSERRKYFGETNENVNKKIKKALAAGLKVIFCIGENEGEDKQVVLEKQIKEGLAGVPDITNIIIAYEPVWAIGTGKNCSVEDTVGAITFIKEIVGDLKVFYGGSVNSNNSGDYLKNAQVNGLLVGGASLNVEEFTKIVKSAD